MVRYQKIIVATLLGLLSACSPRGENKSLDEVLALQKSKFKSVSSSVSPETSALLKPITTQLDKVGESSLSSADLNVVADSLSVAINKASYTSRPALTELVSQYRALSAEEKVDSGAMRLLTARTYSILSSELETTKFAL